MARKHLHLWQAARARGAGQLDQARQHAEVALRLDSDSALARVALGLAAPPDEARRWWQAAADTLPAHPYAHLLLGNALRADGALDEARAELAFERSSLEDLQRWSRTTFALPPQPRVEIGAGLGLGAISGFHLQGEGEPFRLTTARATIGPLVPGSEVQLRISAPRPADTPPARVHIALNGTPLETIEVVPEWQTLRLPVPPALRDQPLTLTLTSDTFRPRRYDRASPDNRALGVRVEWAATTAGAP